MKRVKWNDAWKISTPSDSPLIEMMMGGGTEKFIQLPHDAMIHEKRTQETKNAHQTGFYPGGTYTYTKKFDIPADWEGKTILVEFEGVYTNASVFINEDYAGGHPNGYTNFYILANDFLRYGAANEIKVVANNSTEPNSRWYSGSGIYRNVNLLVGDPLHIREDGVRVTTADIEADSAVVIVDTDIVNCGGPRKKVCVQVQITDSDGVVVAEDSIPATAFAGNPLSCRQRLRVDAPRLWNVDTPNLYQCSVKIVDGEQTVDEETVTFGIRKLALDAKHGLRINGQTVKLRGACIHHDNGIIGACTLERAEERRCQQLKAAGFNCIRSSHHPVSKAMLDACDREGMLVMDELYDCWTRSKNINDYAQFFEQNWKTDTEQMIRKDYNHPSVIMYSTGNEIPEAGTAKGAQTSRMLADYVRQLDNTRYVTNAINGLLAGMSRMGEIIADITGMTQEQMAEMMAAQAGEGGSDAGSDGVNSSMNMLVGPMADAMAVSPVLTGIIEEMEGTMDICGYNYLTARHMMKQDKNPNRVVLGTETFPSEIARLWKIVKENDHVIGDMTWTGYDYLGEAGVGVFFYDGRMGFMPNWPSSVAYIGDIDIIGNRRPISYYREIIFGLRKDPYIAVERVNHYGETPNQTAWAWKDNIASWTWDGYEGKPAKVDVLADADEVELFLNGRSLGRKPAGEANAFTASYELTYEPGELKAIAYRDGAESGSFRLETASEPENLAVSVDRSELKADGSDLAYLMISLTDAQGRQNLQAAKEVTVTVEGAGTLQGFGSADPETTNYYDNTVWNTYDGHVLAVVRAGMEPGEIKVTVAAEGCESKTITLSTK